MVDSRSPPYPTPTPNPSLWECIKLGYEDLVKSIIRPDRVHYDIEDLGPNACSLGNQYFIREDIQLVNYQGKKLQCSWWRPVESNTNNATTITTTTTTSSSSNTIKRMPCIISLHGNSSCRLACMEIIQPVLMNGFTLFAFDFTGSGLSEGDYVSLGYHESYDIQTVLAYLRTRHIVSDIILWGRSMGSVACMLCAEREPNIKAMILDSPFAKFSQLAIELVDEGKLNVPKIAVKFILYMIRRDVKRKAGFDISKLKPIDIIENIDIPCLFCVAENDELIPPRHGEQLYTKHKGRKRIVHVKGGHNDRRSGEFYNSAIQFIREASLSSTTLKVSQVSLREATSTDH